ncbi:hypothetical protein SAICODRAFT_92276 [Saitoella complicata NRRL Y-17804]|nr:uncharacterized protein SAICODRAFT_92276 [Saitoella complicata NRRL Y-17804]ODQ53197.1 hypothetical protein SAICODRAFT_92276 [Saitoella complicata NRRL Y-17804]
MKDGGAFVRFASDPALTMEEIEAKLQEHLSGPGKIHPWFNPLEGLNGWVVRGKPWLEDLAMRYPSRRLRVEFEGAADLPQEKLYELFRRYGRLVDIVPASPKDSPRVAQLVFGTRRSAIAAKNCLHGMEVGGIKMRITYERTHSWARALWDWIVNHPRVTIPAFAALFATILVTIFDPVRTWFIKNKISRSWHLEESSAVQWLKRNTVHLIGGRRRSLDDERAAWMDRGDSAAQIQGWLGENKESFIVVQGPRGSGKRELVLNGVLKGRKNVLVLDCENLAEQHGDSNVIKAAANQTGYFPVFSWLNSMSSMLDLAAQGTIGQKTGFTETLETQFRKILQNTATALKTLAIENKPTTKPVVRDEDYLENHPEVRPVVVIDNFLYKAESGNMVLYENMATWAALLCEANVAHVIFLTNDMGYAKTLAKALPDRVPKVVTLGDANPAAAEKYVIRRLQDTLEDTTTTDGGEVKATVERKPLELSRCIQVLGGRLTDLEVLALRIRNGETPEAALSAMVKASAAEVMKAYFLAISGGWKPEQAYVLLRGLAENGEMKYNEALLDPMFGDSSEAIQALGAAEMISIATVNGRPSKIKPGKPIFRESFRTILEDKVFCARMELDMRKALKVASVSGIQKAEEELRVVRALGLESKGWFGRIHVSEREKYLRRQIKTEQKNVMRLEEEMAQLKAVLKTDA